MAFPQFNSGNKSGNSSSPVKAAADVRPAPAAAAPKQVPASEGKGKNRPSHYVKVKNPETNKWIKIAAIWTTEKGMSISFDEALGLPEEFRKGAIFENDFTASGNKPGRR